MNVLYASIGTLVVAALYFRKSIYDGFWISWYAGMLIKRMAMGQIMITKLPSDAIVMTNLESHPQWEYSVKALASSEGASILENPFRNQWLYFRATEHHCEYLDWDPETRTMTINLDDEVQTIVLEENLPDYEMNRKLFREYVDYNQGDRRYALVLYQGDQISVMMPKLLDSQWELLPKNFPYDFNKFRDNVKTDNLWIALIPLIPNSSNKVSCLIDMGLFDLS